MFKIEIENHLNLAAVRKAATGATKKGIADATAYLWKVTKNSIKKRDGKQKKYDLKILGVNGWEETVQEHLSKEHNKNNITVIRDDKRDVRNPLLQNTYRQQKSAPAGSPPYSHKTKQKGWQDYWLRKGVQADFRQGLVYLNPSRIDKGKTGRSKSIPQLIEEGGTARSVDIRLIGYYVMKKKFKNQKTKVSYSQIFSKKSWKYHFQSRPFMKLALKKSKERILQIFQKALK